MNLYMVLYTTVGVIGGTWGPLPYDMNECLERSKLTVEEIASKADKIPTEFKGMLDWKFSCEYHDVRPKLGE